jgi:hypothetical protein
MIQLFETVAYNNKIGPHLIGADPVWTALVAELTPPPVVTDTKILPRKDY